MITFGLLAASIIRGRFVLPLPLFAGPYVLQAIFVGYLRSEGDGQGLTALVSMGPVVAGLSFVGLFFTAVVPVDTFGRS